MNEYRDVENVLKNMVDKVVATDNIDRLNNMSVAERTAKLLKNLKK
jgi:hypothetical protein